MDRQTKYLTLATHSPNLFSLKLDRENLVLSQDRKQVMHSIKMKVAFGNKSSFCNALTKKLEKHDKP